MSDNIQELVNDKIEKIKEEDNMYRTGRILYIRDYILEVQGLEDVAFMERVTVGSKAIGYVTAIRENSVMVSILKQNKNIYINDEVTATGEEFKAAFAPESIGHVVDMFGVNQINGKEFERTIPIEVETAVTKIMDRREVNRPLRTGISGIDMLYPIGKGQRQLIIGDKRTGKTQIGLDTIVNQRGENVLCIYVAIGKTKKNVKEIYEQLAKRGAMEYTMILMASSGEKPTILSLTPAVALSIAKQLMLKKLDVLVVLDDLKRHADVYREISLLVGKEPGRDAYPSDIFYTHSRLLEQGCQHKDGGSITVLPIMETRGEDITDYISTNVISITDGQIVLSKKSFDKGQKPAINYGLSVSRLGSAVQEQGMKEIGARVRRELLSYLETRDIYELANVEEMSPELQNKLKRGQEMLGNFNQYKFQPRNMDEMISMFDELVGDKQ